jgi:hypothetical protein
MLRSPETNSDPRTATRGTQRVLGEWRAGNPFDARALSRVAWGWQCFYVADFTAGQNLSGSRVYTRRLSKPPGLSLCIRLPGSAGLV